MNQLGMLTKAVLLFVCVVGYANAQSSNMASCRDIQKLWAESEPIAKSLTAANDSLGDMINVATQDSIDTPAAFITSYEAMAAVDNLSFSLSLLSLLPELRSPEDRQVVLRRFNSSLPATIRRMELAVRTINTYAVQMKRPGFAQQVLRVRDAVENLRAFLAAECLRA